jgi:radical SAM protein with 4Fe4S-binding SPASM domain
MSEKSENYYPYLLAVNLTRRCNLNCPHCYIDAQHRQTSNDEELDVGELSILFQDISQRAPGTIIVLTGGEPLLRGDLNEIIKSGVDVGLRMVLGTNGFLLNETKIKNFKKIGLSGIGISLDSIYANQHDFFRGVRGAFQKSCEAIQLCNAINLHSQVHFTITRENSKQLEEVVDLARDLGAAIINFFFLICTGRGKNYIDLSPELYEEGLQKIASLQENSRGIMIQTRCTPHFKRILYENDPRSSYTRAMGYDGGGCPAATHYCRITPTGDITPCPYMELSAGNIREKHFWDIWDEAVLFQSFRNPTLQGRCSHCEYRLLCGGCRARSLVQSGNLMGEDPNCTYNPQSENLIPIVDSDPLKGRQILWTKEAEARLDKIPGFVRKMIKIKVEERAVSQGLPVITVDLMKKLKEERDNKLGFKFR